MSGAISPTTNRARSAPPRTLITSRAVTATTVTATAAATPTSLHTQPRTPAIAAERAAAWNSGSPQRLADLFVAKGARYTDHDFSQSFYGRSGATEWAGEAREVVQGANVKLDEAFSSGDHVVIVRTFSGAASGAPFSVPVVTVLQTRGHQILTDDDYYSLPAGASAS